MVPGARVTDEIEYYRRTGQLQHTVRVIRAREPERLRWRVGLAAVTQIAGTLRGRERMRIEEPVREIVLDLQDRMLRRESVLDARRVGVDLDRGEILPQLTRWDLRRNAFLIGVDHLAFTQYMHLPDEYSAPIDTAAAVIIARALAGAHKARATRLGASQTTPAEAEAQPSRHVQYMLERSERDKDLARRWIALSRVLLDGAR
ncbi:MAG: hypothetical protein ABW321_15185 [Polyangiales bacterium]